MPNTNEPRIGEWIAKLQEIVGELRVDDYFIGHSIGCQTILRYLEKQNKVAGGAIFIAGWFDLKNMETDEETFIAGPWITIPINIEKIKKVLPRSALIISDNDPYGAMEYNIEKFKEIGSEVLILPNAGHIIEEDGITELPTVIEILDKWVGYNIDTKVKPTEIERTDPRTEAELLKTKTDKVEEPKREEDFKSLNKSIFETLSLLSPNALVERRKHRQLNLEKIMGMAFEFRNKNKHIKNDDVEKLLHARTQRQPGIFGN